jgi:hypothetical protein
MIILLIILNSYFDLNDKYIHNIHLFGYKSDIKNVWFVNNN